MEVCTLSNKNEKRMLHKMLQKANSEAWGIKDVKVHAQNTERTNYYRGYLWRLFLGSVETKVPDHWSIDYFRYVLFYGGQIGVTEFMGSIIPFMYNATTYNRWRYPVTVMSADEVGCGERHVGVDCELIYLDTAGYGDIYSIGISSLIDIYAEKLSNIDGAIDINLLNSRTPYIFEVEDTQQMDDMRALYTKIMNGQPAVYYRNRKLRNDLTGKSALPITILPVKQNYISDLAQEEKRSVISEFLTAIGVNNVNYEKKERLITDEVNGNNEELQCAVALWQSNVNRCIKKVKDMFNIELSVTFGANRIRRTENESNRTGNSLPDSK